MATDPASEPRAAKRGRIVDAAGGGSVGVLLVWVLDLFGVPITPAAAAVLATMIAAGCVALGRNGIRGLVVRLWRGGNGNGH